MKLLVLATIAALGCLLICCDAAPVQNLPVKPGYIPVFIRYGDEPLENINPDLAIAFREFGMEGRNFKDDDDENMLADSPADPKPDSSPADEATVFGKPVNEEEEEMKPAEAPKPDDSSSSSTNESSSSASSESQEAPKALPVQPPAAPVVEAKPE